MSEIAERIAREIGSPDLVERLSSDVAGSDLHSLLLEVYRRRAGARTPADLIADHERNRFAQPSTLDPLLLLEFDRAAFAALPAGFERVALAPVVPLGASSVVATIDQNVTIATIRNTEVLSDPTNVLALECAVRRRALRRAKATAAQRVRLAASHRVARAQKFDGPLQVAHFALFGLVTAGRDGGGHRFETEALAEHVAFHARLLRDGLGLAPERIRSAITPLDDALHAWLAADGLDALRAVAGGARVEIDTERPTGRNYYESVCFKFFAVDATGREVELGDGGATPWTRRLLSDRKERLMISGIGSERACTVFGDALRARIA